MSDLAPRPRGGWQVGTHFGRDRDRRGPYGPDHPDPSPDCYGVAWNADRSKVSIRHFTHPDDDTPCCIREVTRRVGESDAEMLARAYPPFALCAREPQ